MTGSSVRLRRALVEELRSQGVLASSVVADAFLGVPREHFLAQVTDRDGLEAVYRNEAIVTRRDELGMPVSSSSQPSIMAAMLEALTLGRGQRVLEVGTGTGYNAALLAALVGRDGRVTSVELDPELAGQAGAALGQLDAAVNVVVGDGHRGWPAGAPYDRIMVTASSPNVPRAWFDQLVDDGLLVMPLLLREPLQAVVVLRRTGGGFESTAVIPAGFMSLRTSLDEPAPTRSCQLCAIDDDGASPRRPLIAMSGPALPHLDAGQRRHLLALALGPPRAVPLLVHGRRSDLRSFLTLVTEDRHLIEWQASEPAACGRVWSQQAERAWPCWDPVRWWSTSPHGETPTPVSSWPP